MPFLGDKGRISVIEKSAGVFSIEWSIPNFLSLGGERGDYYESPYVHACGVQWFFEIHPKETSRIQRSEYVNIFLIGLVAATAAAAPKTLNVTLGIKGPEGVEKMREQIKLFSDSNSVICWRDFCRRLELSDRQSALMPANVLTLNCIMKNAVTNVTKNSSTQTVKVFKDADDPCEENLTLEKQGGEKALDDLGKLLASGEQSDVTVQVGGVEFKVHSLILFARCPPLSASLQHESREKATNRIVIEDCKPDVFGDFLQYLYTGSIQSLTEKNVFKLYGVADKYLADDLKQQCLEHIRNSLCVQTLCETIKLALTHGESGLLQLATDFAFENIEKVVCSVEWQNFNCEYPRQVNEILIKYFSPRS